jgi:hypothetical protein
MKLETAFNCGDKAWAFNGERAEELTIGQIRIEYTNSDGINDGAVEPGCGVRFDNYKAQSGYKEEYMCVETGVGSGRIFTLGKMIFASEDACRLAFAKEIKRRNKEKADAAKWKREQTLREEAVLRLRLAEIERLKAEA